MKTFGRVLAALGIGVCSAFVITARADDWTQWRGQKRDGISQEKGLLRSWESGSPKLLWQIKNVGSGYSTPSVAGNRLYLQSNEGTESESVRAFSTKDGAPLWSTKIGKVGNPLQQPNYPGARSTPTIEGKFLYALGSDGDLVCLSLLNGNIVWKKNLRTDFGGKPGVWAYAESPLIDSEKLIVSPGGETASLIALDKKSGNPLWKTAVPGEGMASYSSAIVMEVGGVRQYVQYLANGLTGVDAKTGKVLWRYDKSVDKQYRMHAATPVASGDLVFSSAASGGGVARIGEKAGSYTAEQVYNERKVPNALGGTIKIGDYLYGTTSSQLMCLNYATGQVVWADRSVGAGSLCYAEGNLYVHGENGEVALVEATPKAYTEKGRFTPPNAPDRGASKAWVYPVVSQGRLYIRELNALWCYDVSAKKE